MKYLILLALVSCSERNPMDYAVTTESGTFICDTRAGIKLFNCENLMTGEKRGLILTPGYKVTEFKEDM